MILTIDLNNIKLNLLQLVIVLHLVVNTISI